MLPRKRRCLPPLTFLFIRGCASTVLRITVEALTVALSLPPQEKLEKMLRSDKNKRKTLKWAMTGDSNEPKFLCNAQASKRASLRA